MYLRSPGSGIQISQALQSKIHLHRREKEKLRWVQCRFSPRCLITCYTQVTPKSSPVWPRSKCLLHVHPELTDNDDELPAIVSRTLTLPIEPQAKRMRTRIASDEEDDFVDSTIGMGGHRWSAQRGCGPSSVPGCRSPRKDMNQPSWVPHVRNFALWERCTCIDGNCLLFRPSWSRGIRMVREAILLTACRDLVWVPNTDGCGTAMLMINVELW